MSRCALARCPRSATTTIRACGTVHVCEPCRARIEQAAAQQPEAVEVPNAS
ncbi:hypothetical protein [Streptosporangium sp. NPDC020145]|uniref:hypothetical protein n=1 Tax=Streptosporangium sp. NPDC020145 TaxID=3154694 RepID=UPI0034152A32